MNGSSCRIHEVHASRGGLQLEFLFNERGEDLWKYRRDRTVVRSISDFRAEAALPVLPPEIVLLYGSHNPSKNNLADFRVVWPRLSSEARQWLADAMVRVQPLNREHRGSCGLR